MLSGPLYPTQMIRHAEIDGLTVIMDLAEEDYFVMDKRATACWRALCAQNGDLPAAAKVLEAEYPDADTRPDLDSLLRACVDRGYLGSRLSARTAEEDLAARRAPCLRYLTVQAWWALFTTTRDLRWRGLAYVYQRNESLARRRDHDHPDRALSMAVDAFTRAENLFWLPNAPNDCLPRSLALYRFLSALGFAVHHCVGGRRFPALAMHAWVEHGGTPVLEDPSRIAGYVRLACIPSN